MSGFKQLDRLSLQRRARRQAIAQDNRSIAMNENAARCRDGSRRSMDGCAGRFNPAAFASLSRNISAPGF